MLRNRFFVFVILYAILTISGVSVRADDAEESACTRGVSSDWPEEVKPLAPIS